jgi:hypothetical protein
MLKPKDCIHIGGVCEDEQGSYAYLCAISYRETSPSHMFLQRWRMKRVQCPIKMDKRWEESNTCVLGMLLGEKDFIAQS